MFGRRNSAKKGGDCASLFSAVGTALTAALITARRKAEPSVRLDLAKFTLILTITSSSIKDQKTVVVIIKVL